MALIVFAIAFATVLVFNIALRNRVAPDRELVWVPLIVVTGIIAGIATFLVMAFLAA